MHILLTGNTDFKIANFRAGLIAELIESGHRVTVLVPKGSYVDTLIDLGCDVRDLKLDRNGTNIFKELYLLFQFLRAFMDLTPDYVFSYTVKNNIYSGIICRFFRIRFAPNITGLGPGFNSPGVLRKTISTLYKFALKRSKRVFFQNNKDLEFFLREQIVSPKKVALLPGSGVDLAAFAYTDLPDSSDEIVFLLVSRLLEEKGVAHFVEAATRVQERFENARFLILGPYDLDSKSAIQPKQMDNWIKQGSISYLGSATDVRPYLQKAHCVVLPTWYNEGTPRTLLEACALGRPIITTDIPGCRDVVGNSEAGLLIAPNDLVSLTSAIVKMLEMPETKRRHMGREARKRAEDHFSEAIVINEYVNLLTNNV